MNELAENLLQGKIDFLNTELMTARNNRCKVAAELKRTDDKIAMNEDYIKELRKAIERLK